MSSSLLAQGDIRAGWDLFRARRAVPVLLVLDLTSEKKYRLYIQLFPFFFSSLLLRNLSFSLLLLLLFIPSPSSLSPSSFLSHKNCTGARTFVQMNLCQFSIRLGLPTQSMKFTQKNSLDSSQPKHLKNSIKMRKSVVVHFYQCQMKILMNFHF